MNNTLKITDFGLAKKSKMNEDLTNLSKLTSPEILGYTPGI